MKEKFLKSYKILKIPIMTKKVPAWEERYSLQKIKELKKRVGNHAFETQMMLKRPDKKKNAFFNADLLDFYNEKLSYREANSKAILSLGETKLVYGLAFWDPSVAHKKSDKSVLSCVFQDTKGFYYLHEISYLAVKKSSNSAQEQCDQIIEILKKNYLNTLVIETNGIGAFLPELFRLRTQIAGYPVAVKSLHSHQGKAERIVETLDPLLSSGFLKCHKSVKKTPLIEEINTWFPEAKFANDDGLDSVCGAIMAEPVRIRKLSKNLLQKRKNWI